MEQWKNEANVAFLPVESYSYAETGLCFLIISSCFVCFSATVLVFGFFGGRAQDSPIFEVRILVPT